MRTCEACKDLMKKSRRNPPHENLMKLDERRVYKGLEPRGYEEQDYQCLICQSRFTWSSNKNDIAWTFWQG